MKISLMLLCLTMSIILMLLSGVTFADTAPPTGSGLKLVSFYPAAGGTDVCIDTPLHLTFNGSPILSPSGIIQIIDEAGTVVDSIDASFPLRAKTIGGLPGFNYYPIIITENKVVIAFKNSIFEYGKTYEVKIPDGLFVDKDGHAANLDAVESWRFSTKKSPPEYSEKGTNWIIIADDGTGDFATVQGALDFIPDGNTAHTVLFVRKGSYREIIYVAGKHNLTIYGEDRKQTIITYTNSQAINNTDGGRMTGGYRRGMIRALGCNDLTIARLTLHNTTPLGGGQAETLILHAKPDARAVITEVDMISHQDTLQIVGQAYISNCTIEGDVDFMWGSGPCFFENCRLRAVRNKSMFTQIRNPATNHGFVYKNCTFEGAPGVRDCVLSRVFPGWFPHSEVVLIDCILTDAISPVGWHLDGPENGPPADAPDIHFWEFNSRDPEGKPIDNAERLAVSKRLTREADAEIIANYSNPIWVLGNGWDPKQTPIFAVSAPESEQGMPDIQHPAFFLVGDSLMNTGQGSGETGPWGYGSELISLFDPAKIHVYNLARGGRSSRSYREEGLWEELLARMEPGDWVLVEFGHNDSANSTNHPDRISGQGSGDEMIEVAAPDGSKRVHTYGWYLKQYVRDASEKGAKVIIASPVPRNRWEEGRIKRGFDGYVQWANDAAKSSGAFYVNLNGLAADRYDALGQEEAKRMFFDLQHTKKGGARMNAEAFAVGLKKLKDCPLSEYLAQE